VGERHQRRDVAREAHRVAEQVVQVDAAPVVEMGRAVMVARRGGEDGRVELARKEIRDHRLLERGGAAGEVLHVAEEVPDLRRLRPTAQDGALLDPDDIEPAPLVLGPDLLLALLAVEDRSLDVLDQLLHGGVGRERHDRPDVGRAHVPLGKEAGRVVAELLADACDREERVSRRRIGRGLRRGTGERVQLLAPLGMLEGALEMPGKPVDLRQPGIEPDRAPGLAAAGR
jgi:hypothetical protein